MNGDKFRDIGMLIIIHGEPETLRDLGLNNGCYAITFFIKRLDLFYSVIPIKTLQKLEERVVY